MDLIDILLEVVLRLDLLFSLLVSLLMLLSLFDESVDFLLGESTLLVGDGDVRSFSGSLVLGSDGKNTVSIKVERDFNLRNSSGSRGDSVKVELTQQVVVGSHRSFSFEDLDLDSWLIVLISSEDLGLLDRDSGVSLNEFGHDTSGSLNSKR